MALTRRLPTTRRHTLPLSGCKTCNSSAATSETVLRWKRSITSQQQADKLYSSTTLGQSFRYGLTAGVIPNGYHADRIFDHPFNVFSPEAVAAWGDMNTLLSFYAQQNPASDPRYRYGMVRVSAQQPGWIPSDAGLVDHMFLLFGLVESLDPNFFTDYMIPGLAPGDYNADGVVDQADYAYWRTTFAATNRLAADGSNSNQMDAADYVVWRKSLAAAGLSSSVGVPEPRRAGFLARRRWDLD